MKFSSPSLTRPASLSIRAAKKFDLEEIRRCNYRALARKVIGWAFVTVWLLPNVLSSKKSFAAVEPPQTNETDATDSGAAAGEQTNRPVDDLKRLDNVELSIKATHYSEAETLLRDYLNQYPTSWRAHYDLGYVLFSMRGGRLSLADAIKESIGELSRSLVLNINNSDAHKILALDLVMIQRQDLAETEFKAAERLNPDSSEVHYLLGRHYMEQSNYVPAKKELEAAIQLNSTYMKAYENLGITFDRLGDGPHALAAYLTAIKLDEKLAAPSEFPYLDLSRYYHDHDQIEQSQNFALKALDINPRSDQTYFELARNYRERAEWSKAAQTLTKAIAINPRSAQYYYLLGLTYHKLGAQQLSRQAFANYAKYRDLTTPLSDSSQP